MKNKSRLLSSILVCFMLLQSNVLAAKNQRVSKARELLVEMRFSENLIASAKIMAHRLGKNDPERTRKLEAFFVQIYSGEEALKEMSKAYASAYTESEMNLLLEFYKSPVGRKSLDIAPKLMSVGMTIGQKLVNARAEELNRLLEEPNQ